MLVTVGLKFSSCIVLNASSGDPQRQFATRFALIFRSAVIITAFCMRTALHVCNGPPHFDVRDAGFGPFCRQNLVTPGSKEQYGENPPQVRDGQGVMDELIGRLVADTGVDRASAETAVGIILNFLVQEAPAEKVRPLLARLPGAEALMTKVATESGDGEGGPMGGGSMGGVMGAGMRLMAAGLSMGQAQNISREIIAYAREKAGADVVGEIVSAIPGLAQFV